VIGVALKGILGRKLRTVLTGLAVVLGVAMVSGSYVLTDTLDSAFGGIFERSYGDTAAVIKGKQVVEGSRSGSPTVPERLLPRVERVPGVESASGAIFDLGSDSNSTKLIDSQGEPIGSEQSSSIAFGVNPDETESTPFSLASGDWATGPGQVAVDQATAEDNGLAAGDRIEVAARGTRRQMTVAGTVEFGSLDSLGGTTLAVFDLETAQRLVGKRGQLDQISVQAEPGVPSSRLVADLDRMLGPSLEVSSGADQAQTDAEDSEEALSTIRTFLLAFAGIALFVGAFVIFNTFSMTVAQRVRELATLRTLGGSRRQILTSLVIEGFVIGAVASVIGLFLGLALAEGLTALFGALGLELPEAPTVFATRTVIVSLLLGTVVTMAASLAPALRATRVPPIAAVREGATLPMTALSRRGRPIAAVLALVAAALWAIGVFGDFESTTALLFVGGAALALFLGVVLISPRVARPLASAIGLPLRRFGGVPGELGVHNAGRNPTRTARTATALMIGLTLVTLVASLGSGLRGAIRGALEDQVLADYVLQPAGETEGVPVSLERRIERAGLAESVAGVRSDRAVIAGTEAEVTGVDPEQISSTYRFYGLDEAGTRRALSGAGTIVDKDFAEQHGLTVGERYRMTVPSGRRLALEVRAIDDPPAVAKLSALMGKVTIAEASFDRAFQRPTDKLLFVNLGAAGETAAAGLLAEGAERIPGIEALPREDWIDEEAKGINTLLNLLYVLLGLSVVVSLFGMLNALVLSVFERTRELGMLRAVGMTRRQLRRMIRNESIVIALIGAGVGMALGLVLAAMVADALSAEGVSFAVPAPTLVAFAAIAAVAGVLAALLPARRAGRLDILDALHYE
jgi:putative ABC transport system permease protein